MKTERTEERIGCVTHNSDWCTKDDVPSDEEVTALNDMREIEARVKELKKRQSKISLNNGEYLEEKSRQEKEVRELKGTH